MVETGWTGNKAKMYGNFEGCPLLYCIPWVGNRMNPGTFMMYTPQV